MIALALAVALTPTGEANSGIFAAWVNDTAHRMQLDPVAVIQADFPTGDPTAVARVVYRGTTPVGIVVRRVTLNLATPIALLNLAVLEVCHVRFIRSGDLAHTENDVEHCIRDELGQDLYLESTIHKWDLFEKFEHLAREGQ